MTDLTSSKMPGAEGFYRLVFENTLDSIFIVDAESGRIIDANRAALDRLGYTREEIVTLRVPDLHSPESIARAREILGRLKKGEPQVVSGLFHRRKDGSLIPVEVSANPIVIGGMKYNVAIARDMSEKIRAETFFKVLFEKASDAIALVDLESFRIVEANEETCRSLGYARDELVGREPTDFIAEIEPDRVRKMLEPVVQGRGPTRILAAHRHRDGSTFPVEARVSLLELAGRRYLLATVRDVSEQVRAGKELEEAKSLLEHVQESAGDGLVLLDDQGVIVSVNRMIMETMKKTREELVGRHFLEFIDKEDTARSGEAFQRVMRGQSARMQGRLCRDDGKRIHVEVNAVPLDRGGKRYGSAIVRDVSDRVAAEEALRESEERWRSLVANAPDHIMTVDREGRIQSINYTVPELSEQEVLGRPVYDFMTAESHEISRNSIEKVFATGESTYYEVTRVGPDGETQWFSSRLGPVYRGEEVAAAVIIATNITERKQAEEKLSALAEERGLLLSHTRDFVYRHDIQGVFTYMSPSIELVTGRTAEEFLTHYTEYLTDNPINQRVVEYTEETLRTGRQSPPYLVEVFHADARRITLEVVESAYYENGRIAGVVGVGRDVTERLQAEEALRYQKSLLESTSEAAIDGILVVSTEGKMISFNRRFVQMWELPENVAAARSDEAALRAVIDKLEDPDEFLKRVNHLYAHPTEESRDEIRLKDGRTFDRYSAPVRSQEGMIYGRVWYFRDVTGRKRTEEELRRAAEETRKAYEDLKRAQAQLIRSEKLASIGMLVSGVAHEINNPLNVMYGNLKLMADACDQMFPLVRRGAASRKAKGVEGQLRRFRSMMRDATKAAEHARGIVEDFRGFARDVRTAEVVDLNRCLEEALTLVQREIQPRIKLVKRFRKVPTVRCMRGQISQVFLNLLTNAVEAIDKKGTITLRTLQDDGSVVVEVADTGRGMPEEVREKLFEPFFTTKPQGKGLGLGLSISAMIIHNHGGEITCTSRPGRGSTFRMSLPLRS